MSCNSSSFTLKNNLWGARRVERFVLFSMTGNVWGIPRTDIFVDESKGNYHIEPYAKRRSPWLPMASRWVFSAPVFLPGYQRILPVYSH